ncbi:hypothetical protein BMF81_04017 [Nodularia spumigena UHCC 0039]|uniref:Uncharacterized protein n=1 Tax=Nodularia spumigena UHCC 0039 TaxID=1914872 RepID=A0A2S0Q4Q6_NODSP|nr:hypothetical protein BMF81_04017 [Nodularia spumigena UHCC 0039]
MESFLEVVRDTNVHFNNRFAQISKPELYFFCSMVLRIRRLLLRLIFLLSLNSSSLGEKTEM